MISFGEYCKNLKEDWGKTSPIPKEVYDFPDPLKGMNWIDLGLPSGTLWADANLPNPDNGTLYWSWDEIMNSDYAPYVPTKEQIRELDDNCKLRLDKVKEGMLFTSMANGKEIFLPADGYRGNSTGEIGNVGVYGNYYSATCLNNNVRYVFAPYFSMGDYHPAFVGNYCTNPEVGRSVRLVRNKN